MSENKIQLKTDWQESFTVQQLKDTAKAIGLKNYSKLKKKELIDLIKNSIHSPQQNIVYYSIQSNLPVPDDKSEKKLKKLEKELKQLKLKSQVEEQERKLKEDKEELERKIKKDKEDLEREKYRQVIKKSRYTFYNELSDEEKKLMENIGALMFYMANCRDRQELIKYCNENNFPVPNINGNF
jgi:hypothetical protein